MKYEFGWLFDPIIYWLKQHKVELYAHFVSNVTAGKLFWPGLHTEPDVWYTVLVCIDYGRGYSLVKISHLLLLAGCSGTITAVY